MVDDAYKESVPATTVDGNSQTASLTQPPPCVVPCPTPHPFTPTPTPLHRTAPHRMPAGYLTMIDTVLLPFDPATLPAGGNGGVAAAVGAPAGCNLQANAGLSNGSSVVLGGATNRQRTGAVGRWQGVVWMKCLSPPLGTHWFAE